MRSKPSDDALGHHLEFLELDVSMHGACQLPVVGAGPERCPYHSASVLKTVSVFFRFVKVSALDRCNDLGY